MFKKIWTAICDYQVHLLMFWVGHLNHILYRRIRAWLGKRG